MVFDGTSNYLGHAQTKNQASPVGGLLFEFELSPLDIESFHQPDSVVLETDDNTQCFGWVRVSENPLLYSVTSVISRVPEPEQIPIAIGDRLSIQMRDDGIVEFYRNRFGPSSQPVAISGVQVNRTKLFRAHVRHEVVISENDKVAVHRIRWFRSGPEWTYNARAQVLDYGSLPATIKARVRQRALFLGGPTSPWVEGVFTR